MHIIQYIVAPSIINLSVKQLFNGINIAVFNCTVTAKPVANITWLKDEDHKQLKNTSRIKITYTTDGKKCDDDNSYEQCLSYSTLQLLDTKPVHSGHYTCKAHNSYSSDLQSVYLTVQGNCYYILYLSYS